MLEEMSPREFDEWLMRHDRDPWGDDWPQASVVSASIINAIRIAMAMGERVEDRDLLPLDFFVPKRKEETETSHGMTAEQYLAYMRGGIGV